MSYERICSTVRVVVPVTGITYVPHTLIQYQTLIDRVSHTSYFVTVIEGPPPDQPDLYDEHLTETDDDLDSSFEVFISDKRWNNNYTSGNVVVVSTVNLVHSGSIDRGLQNLMKDYNYQLVSVLCAAFITPAMTVYHHLVNLEFVKNTTSCETNFGRIPHTDVYYPHIQLFGKLTGEYFKVGCLLGSSSDKHFELFTSSNLTDLLESYKKSTDPWFVSVKSLNFDTGTDRLD